MTQSVEQYFQEGCGRCPLGGTPDCKVHLWTEPMAKLRQIILSCGLREESKWGVACYTYEGKNILLLSAFKSFCSINLFKGALIKDDQSLLEMPGPNSQSARLLKFKTAAEVKKIEEDIRNYIFEAIEIEKAGLTVSFQKNPEPIPEELETKFNEDPLLRDAFEALTPGRQRGYLIHFSQPKQSATRTSRIEKCIPMILSGIGMHDKYKSRKK